MSNTIQTIKALYTKLIGNLTYKSNGLWIFGEWFGERCCDNSMYMANYIAEHHPQIKCVWIAKKHTDLSGLKKTVRRVEYDSDEAKDMIRNASVLFMNQGYGDLTRDCSNICAGALKVNLWHGVPWKRIGLDGNKSTGVKRLYYAAQNSILASDYYLSLSDEFTSIMKSAFMISQKHILRSGYPRNSIFYDPSALESCRSMLLQRLNRLDNKNDIRIITYMPTFRDNSKEVFSFAKLINDIRLISILEQYNAIVVEKSHFAASKSANSVSSKYIYFLNDFPAQELLAATDLLITDYSSCFFDFLLRGKPIIHYLYDYEYYSTKDRGLYYSKQEVCCGDMPDEIDSLITAIDQNLSDEHRNEALRKQNLQRYMTYERQNSCEQIFDFLKNKVK